MRPTCCKPEGGKKFLTTEITQVVALCILCDPLCPLWSLFYENRCPSPARRFRCAPPPARRARRRSCARQETRAIGRDRRPHHPRRRIQHLRSEEHTSELQSLTNLVCRLL